jgi:hypothetical protein
MGNTLSTLAAGTSLHGNPEEFLGPNNLNITATERFAT